MSPFLTYFPAVTLATMFLGARWGVFVLISSAILADYMFLGPTQDWAVSANELGLTLLFIAAGGLITATAIGFRLSLKDADRALKEAETARANEHLLNMELRHRVKNNLAVVQSVARQTLRNAESFDTAYLSFTERLLALSEAHDVLSTGNWAEVGLPRLVEAALRSFSSEAISSSGPSCSIPAVSCVPLVLALHELATNATKHGALSAPGGLVDVTWDVADGRLALRWQERFGPPVAPPTRRGFGSRLLGRQAGLEDVQLEFPTDGLVCRITVTGAFQS